MKIYISKSSIRKSILQKNITLLDLPKFVREQGFEGIEISDRDISTNKNFLEKFMQACSQSNCGVIIDINTDLTLQQEEYRRREINHCKEIINIANKIGVRYLRICLGGQSFSIQKVIRRLQKLIPVKKATLSSKRSSSHKKIKFFIETFIIYLSHNIRRNTTSSVKKFEQKIANAIDSLRQITSELDNYQIKLGIENHWGISNRPENIMEIVKRINNPYLGTCPDFGNFPMDIDTSEGLMMLAPKAFIVHAKCYGFNKNWEDKRIDFSGCLRIFKKYGFKGPVTVEFEGNKSDMENCNIARQLIKRHL